MYYLLRLILVAVIAVILILLLVLVNMSMLASYVCVRPFTKNRHREISLTFARYWLQSTRLMMQKLFKSRFTLEITTEKVDLRHTQHALLICNHQSMLDILLINWLTEKYRKDTAFTWLGKHTFKYVPLLGWGAYLTDSLIYLRREWTKDHQLLQETLSSLGHKGRPFWLAIFPEGTRMTPTNHQKSQAYCRENSHAPYQHVLLPRHKGFTASVQALRHKITAIIDVTICYSSPPPLFGHILRGKKINIHLQARAINIGELPTDPEGLKDWLLGCYRRKDMLIENRHKES